MKPALLSHLSPFTKILFVLMLILASMILAVMISVVITMLQYHTDMTGAMLLISDTGDSSSVPLLKELQIVQSVFIFIIPALLAGFFFTAGASAYFGLKRSLGWMVVLLVVFVLFFSLPLINWMISLNESMQLPAFLSGIEDWMQAAEDQAGEITEKILAVQTPGGFAVNLIMIAIIPALGEELMFRGVFQRLFREWTGNIHLAVLFSALLFAMVHLQFYGLLPRLMLGICFGYLYHWSGTIWVPVIAHFLNNAAAVVASYLSNIGLIRVDYENVGSTDNLFLILASAVLTGMAMFWIYKREEFRKSGKPGMTE